MTGAGLHVLDAFVNIAGPIVSVDARAVARKPPPDPRDAVAVLCEFAQGATGVLGTVRAAPAFWRIHVFGTKGSAEARGEDSLIVAKIAGATEDRTFEHADSLRVLLEAFADADRRQGAVPGHAGPDARYDRRIRGRHRIAGERRAGESLGEAAQFGGLR